MPLFKFNKNSKKSKEVPKKASSMNNIYNDYSGSGGGATKKEVNFEETDEIKQFNGRCVKIIVRGHAQTTWTVFWTFLTPPPPS